MKCSKCGYVGFEAADRCRHCGYDFSLVAVPSPPSAARPVETPRPAAHREARLTAEPSAALGEPAPLLDLPLDAAPAVAPHLAAIAPALTASLFADPQPPPARTPLAVRRTADRPRARTTPHVVRRSRPELLDAGVEAGLPAGPEVAPVSAAPAVSRAVSALLDIALLVGIDVTVVYLTAQMAGVPVAEVTTLPLVPLVTFLLALNLAYLAVFTANGGQTLGKMAMGLRVEGTDGEVTFGSAVVRVAAALAGGLAFGAGFVPALWRADRRAVHDQLAHTRVVKVAA